MRSVVIIAFAIATGAMSANAQPAAPPKPVIQLRSLERYTVGGKEWVRHRYAVTNHSAYAAEMFATAPDLPPCGANSKASRSWVDIYDGNGKRLYGFCALGSPDDLDKIWFATPLGQVPPAAVYIEINDRKTGTKYRSNLAGTSFGPCVSGQPGAIQPG